MMITYTVAALVATSLAPGNFQGNFQATLDQINALRTEPAKAKELLDKFFMEAFTDPTDRNEVLTDAGNRKGLEDFIKFLSAQPRMEPLEWDKEMVALALSGGKTVPSLYNAQSFDAFDDNPRKTLLWSILRGVDFHYKPVFDPKNTSVGIALKDTTCFVATGRRKAESELKAAAAVKLKDAIAGVSVAARRGRPFDPREDLCPPWGDTLGLLPPNTTSFVRADGSLDVVWRDLGAPPKVFLTRFSPAGARVFTKEVPGVDPGQYPLLAGFTEDPQGNLYIARARDEGNISVNQPDPNRTAAGGLDPTWDRPDIMKLTKLSGEGAELWTKNFARKGGDALGFISPLSPNTRFSDPRTPGRDTHSSTSRIGFTTHKGTPIIFVIYGASTEWDPKINGRHQNAYWRTLNATTGEPVDGLNGAGMSHSFDNQLLVSDEGIITVERSDGGLLMGNYLNTRRFPLLFDYFYPTPSDGNNSFTQLGSLAPASDGYLVLFSSNGSTLFQGKSVSGAESAAETIKNRNLAVTRVKKGFAQEIEALAEKPESKPVLDKLLNSMVRSEEREGLQLMGTAFLTEYGGDEKYSAGRPKLVRLKDGNYIVLWERWTHLVSANKRDLEASFDSTWAMKINQNGEVLKPAVQLPETVRITRGDEPVLWNGKATLLSGDVLENKFLLHTIDEELNYKVIAVAPN